MKRRDGRRAPSLAFGRGDEGLAAALDNVLWGERRTIAALDRIECRRQLEQLAERLRCGDVRSLEAL